MESKKHKASTSAGAASGVPPKKGKSRLNADPGIICFRHCAVPIYCFDIPDKCPACKETIRGLEAELEPYKVEYPFVRGDDTACSLVIKPMKGTFMRDYNINSDLHIAATTSTGLIIEYDKRGISFGNADEWQQCLVVKKMEFDLWYRRWDQTLYTAAENENFTADRYEPRKYNCFTFVMDFLRRLRSGEFRWMVPSKEQFCEKFVKRPLEGAIRYIHIYRNVKHNGHFYFGAPL